MVRTCRERAASTKEYLHGCEFVDVIVMDTNAFEGDIDMIELGLWIMNEPVAASVRSPSYWWGRNGRVRVQVGGCRPGK